jgi:hypothetical protein
MDTYELLRNLSEAMRDLPSKCSDSLELLVSKNKPRDEGEGVYSYNLMTGIKNEYSWNSGRRKLWKEKILPYFFSLPAVEAARENGLEIKVKNNIFRSRIDIYDVKTHSRLFMVKSPWFASLFSKLFGSIFKSKLTYVPQSYAPAYA